MVMIVVNGDIERREGVGWRWQCKGNLKTLKRPSVDKDEAKRGKISSWPESSILLIFH